MYPRLPIDPIWLILAAIALAGLIMALCAIFLPRSPVTHRCCACCTEASL